MRRTLLATGPILVLLVAGILAYGAGQNPEKASLDAQARVGAPGEFMDLENGTTHYELVGPDSGHVVVLVHGFSVPYYIWDSTFVRLRGAGYRVLRYDLYGRGLSDRPDVHYDRDLYDHQLTGLLDSLRIAEPINLVGLSFGGLVTADFAGSHPDRVQTLTLIDPMSAASPLPLSLRLPIIGPWLWQTTIVPEMAEGQMTDFLHPENHPTWADQYRPQMRYSGFGRALRSTSLMAAGVDFDDLYGRVGATEVPVLLIWGKQDQTVSLELSDVVRRNIPSVEFVPIDSAGHLPHMEQAPVVHARLLSFLEAHEVAGK